MIRLPFKNHPPALGQSREAALISLLAIEKKRARDSKLNEGYISFMREYQELGHMERVENETNKNSFYLPHSCVINENSQMG